MATAGVLIPEGARPDIISPLVDRRTRRRQIQSKGCSKDGKEIEKTNSKDDGKAGLRPEFRPGKRCQNAEHAAL